EEGTRPTTAGPIEASGEEPAVSNKVPNVAANVDEETNPAVTGTDKPLSSTPSEEELLISSSTATSTISKVTEAGEYTTAERDQSTTSEPVEASGELPTSVDNKVPDVAANIDEKASTGESIPSAFSSTASSADDLLSSTTREPPSFVTERSDETPAVVAESGHFATTSSNVEVEKDHTSAATTPSLPHDASVTEKATEATTAGPAEKEEEEPHVSVKAGDLEASKGDEATTTTSSLAESDTTLEMVKAKTESGVSASSTPSTAFSHGAEEPSASSGPNESEMTVETTTMESDSDKKTTAVPVDFSHEGAVVSEKTPTIAAKIDELTRSMISKSSTATSVTTEEESTSTPASTSTLSGDLANGETENTPSTRTLPAFVTETETPATESHFEESTVATAEVSGEGHSETTEVPMIKASTDEVTTESVQSGSTETASEETTSGMVTTQSGFNPLVVGFDGSTTSTSSTTSSSSTTVPVSPITETSDEETSGVTQPETTSTSTVEGSGEEQSHKDNAPQVETSMDKHTTVADERSTTSQPESSTKIASELGGSVKTKANGTGTEDDEEDSIINPAILEHPHDSNLPANVGFVPSSEPDLLHESREQEEEESEKAVSPKEPDYEDTVKAKTPASAAVTEETTTLAHQSTTTEPPIQLVQDLIDALAGGGLNAIFGPPRRPSEADEADKKLGDLKKYLHKSLEQKRECPATRQMRFVASELTDLTTPFDADTVVYSLQHCAKLCFETGCSTAFFTRYPRPICMMRFSGDMECHSNGTLTTSWNFTRIQEVVRLDCIECDKQHGEIIKQKEQVDITNLNSFSEDDENTVVPTHEGVTSKCEGRIEFQTLPVGSLPPLNVTNDVPARTPADCAKKCFESKGCSLAGFIGSPSGNISHGVCLLTSDISVCGNNADYVPQHAALNPFVISCMKCSSCTYNIRTVTPDRVLPDFNHVESVSSIGECARACHSRRCTMAQYNSQQHTCMTTSEPLDSKCARETAVVTEGILPVTLECVSCVI
uniref:Mucin n=1 Tax=Haemonchus contortus TaxID=6289 RepID=A0A7I4Y772_HAECO